MKHIKGTAIAFITAATVAFAGIEAHWDYEKHGP